MSRLNQSGAVLMNVIVTSLVVGLLSGVIIQQAGRSQNYSRLARVKSAMFAAETQVRSLVTEPSTYLNCDGTTTSSCRLNQDLLTGFRNPVTGAKCGGGADCGVVIRAKQGGVPFFDSATRRFNAVIHYEGSELSLRDIEIDDLIVPQETLIQAAMVCPNDRPLFRGLVNGIPNCEPLPAQCGARQWMTSVDPATLVPTCANYPEIISCPTGQYISGINYSASGMTATCAPRADIYVFNSNPLTGVPYSPQLTSGPPITLKPAKPAPTAPTPKPSMTFIGVDGYCFPTMAQCESSAGAGNCAASSQSVLRAVSGQGGVDFLSKMCDINYPGSLREMPCATGSTVFIWDACRYDGYGAVDWNPPYMRTNYECRVKEYCAVAAPTTTTTPPACRYSCSMAAGAECSPGPAAGCGYSGYVTASGDRNRVGEGCSSQFNFQRTGGGVTCDVGWVACDCGGAPPTMPPPTTPPPPPPTSPPPTSTTSPPPPPVFGSCPDECAAYDGGGCVSSPVQGGCSVFCSGSGQIYYRCR